MQKIELASRVCWGLTPVSSPPTSSHLPPFLSIPSPHSLVLATLTWEICISPAFSYLLDIFEDILLFLVLYNRYGGLLIFIHKILDDNRILREDTNSCRFFSEEFCFKAWLREREPASKWKWDIELTGALFTNKKLFTKILFTKSSFARLFTKTFCIRLIIKKILFPDFSPKNNTFYQTEDWRE